MTKTQCLEDVAELRAHLTLDSISYENIVRSGRFDYGAAFSAIERGIRNFEGEDISETEFLNLIRANLRGIPDHHIALWFGDDYFDLGWHETFFAGSGADFSANVGADAVKVPALSEDGTRFISGVYRKQSVFAMTASEQSNERNEECNQRFHELHIETPKEFKIIATQNQMYIRLPNFNDDSSGEELERFAASGKMARNKNLIVIDLTENQGGNAEHITKFLCNFFGVEYRNALTNALVADCIITKNLLRAASVPFPLRLRYYAKRIFTKKVYVSKPYFMGQYKIYEGENDFAGKIVLVANRHSASTSEVFIQYFRDNFKNVAVIGENTNGVFCYGGPIEYELPHSKLRIQIPMFQIAFADTFPDRLDSDFGLIPDWWCATKGDVLSTLAALGADDDLLPKIRDFYEGLATRGDFLL